MLCSHYVYGQGRHVCTRALIGLVHLSVRGWQEVSYSTSPVSRKLTDTVCSLEICWCIGSSGHKKVEGRVGLGSVATTPSVAILLAVRSMNRPRGIRSSRTLPFFRTLHQWANCSLSWDALLWHQQAQDMLGSRVLSRTGTRLYYRGTWNWDYEVYSLKIRLQSVPLRNETWSVHPLTNPPQKKEKKKRDCEVWPLQNETAKCSVRFRSVQSLDWQGRRVDMRNDSAKILFQCVKCTASKGDHEVYLSQYRQKRTPSKWDCGV